MNKLDLSYLQIFAFCFSPTYFAITIRAYPNSRDTQDGLPFFAETSCVHYTFLRPYPLNIS